MSGGGKPAALLALAATVGNTELTHLDSAPGLLTSTLLEVEEIPASINMADSYDVRLRNGVVVHVFGQQRRCVKTNGSHSCP